MDGRTYDPSLGRFLSADLFVVNPYSAGSFNRYSYVSNNPLSRIDPTGYKDKSTDAQRNHAEDIEEVTITGDRDAYLMRLREGAVYNNNMQATLSAMSTQEYVNSLVEAGVSQLTFVENGQLIIANLDGKKIKADDDSSAAAGVVAGVGVLAGSNGAGISLKDILKGLRISPLGMLAVGMMPTKMGDATLTNAKRENQNLYRGRIQAQGGGLEKSVAWAQSAPPTVAQGLAMLGELRASLSTREARERERSFEQAERFINNAGRAGGVTAPVSRSFPQGSVIRVDIEVINGQAFVP